MFAFAVLPPTPPVRKASVSDTLAAAKAVASYELAWWRKNHPKADIAVEFSDKAITPPLAALVRSRLGYKNPIAVLDAHVLTIVYDVATIPAAKRLGIDAYVFLGSFPKGFRARYLIRANGKEPQVMNRTVLERYEMAPPSKV